jgi:hypothetical protein
MLSALRILALVVTIAVLSGIGAALTLLPHAIVALHLIG